MQNYFILINLQFFTVYSDTFIGHLVLLSCVLLKLRNNASSNLY